jgi:hypothetical protein
MRLYNNRATFTLNGIVLAVCQATSVVLRFAGQHAPHPLRREPMLASRFARTGPLPAGVFDQVPRVLATLADGKRVDMMQLSAARPSSDRSPSQVQGRREPAATKRRPPLTQ